MDSKRIGKEKKIMGEVIQFPTSRIVRRAPPVPKLTEHQEKDMQVSKFVE